MMIVPVPVNTPTTKKGRKQLAAAWGTVAAASVALTGYMVATTVETPSFLKGASKSVFEPSAADICSGDRMCDGYQMMLALRTNGELSLTSPVGKALKTIGNQTGVSDERVTDLMQQLDKNLYTTKNVPSIVEVDGMAIIRPPQYKIQPLEKYSLDNPFQKANYDFVVMTADGDKCVRHTLRPDGTTTRLANGEKLARRVASHAGVDPCGPEVQTTYSRMLGM